MKKIVFKEPGKAAKVMFIEDILEKLQELVAGFIECVPLSGDLTLVCNEEGKLLGLKPNVHLLLRGDVVVGNILIVAYDEEGDLRDLSEKEEEQALTFLNLYGV